MDQFTCFIFLNIWAPWYCIQVYVPDSAAEYKWVHESIQKWASDCPAEVLLYIQRQLEGFRKVRPSSIHNSVMCLDSVSFCEQWQYLIHWWKCCSRDLLLQKFDSILIAWLTLGAFRDDGHLLCLSRRLAELICVQVAFSASQPSISDSCFPWNFVSCSPHIYHHCQVSYLKFLVYSIMQVMFCQWFVVEIVSSVFIFRYKISLKEDSLLMWLSVCVKLTCVTLVHCLRHTLLWIIAFIPYSIHRNR